jgi:hypothetical protein
MSENYRNLSRFRLPACSFLLAAHSPLSAQTHYDIAVGIRIARLGRVFYKMSLIQQIMNTPAIAGTGA